MPKTYTPTPCRRCGGEKRQARYKHEKPRYCSQCEQEVQREHFRKHFAWWCQSCNSPHYCVTCERNKRARMFAACQNRSRPAHMTRPFNAERWLQQRCHSLVQTAIKRGLLPSLKSGEYACADCGQVAHEYDHRDYGRPFDVVPVCRSCNKRRGTAVWPDAAGFIFPRFGPPAANDDARKGKRKRAA